MEIGARSTGGSDALIRKGTRIGGFVRVQRGTEIGGGRRVPDRATVAEPRHRQQGDRRR